MVGRSTARTHGSGRGSAAVWWVLTAAAVLFLGACGTPTSAGSANDHDDAPGSGSDTLAATLAGRTFLSTAVIGRELVADTTVRIEFGEAGPEQSVRLSAGCNSLFGIAQWTGRDHLVVSNMGGTEMGCPEPRMAQDDWLGSVLQAGVDVGVDGSTITLKGTDATVTLLDREIANPDRPLVGTQWVLNGIISGSGDGASVASVPNDIDASLTVWADHLEVFNGLQWLASPGGVPGEAITVGDDTVRVPEMLTGDSVLCLDGGSDCYVDMSVLGHDFRYEITAARLTVTGMGPTAGHGLMFVAGE